MVKSMLLPTNSRVKYGIPASLNATGDQWDYPYAWAPVQYFIFQGLQHYHCNPNHQAVIIRLKTGWVLANDLFFAHTGTLIEKYVTTDPTHDKRVSEAMPNKRGFGWSNVFTYYLTNISHQANQTTALVCF